MKQKSKNIKKRKNKEIFFFSGSKKPQKIKTKALEFPAKFAKESFRRVI